MSSHLVAGDVSFVLLRSLVCILHWILANLFTGIHFSLLYILVFMSSYIPVSPLPFSSRSLVFPAGQLVAARSVWFAIRPRGAATVGGCSRPLKQHTSFNARVGRARDGEGACAEMTHALSPSHVALLAVLSALLPVC